MAKPADARDLKSLGSDPISVQIRLLAPPADTHLVTLRIRIGVCFYVIDICMQFRYNILEIQYSEVPHMKLREIIQYIDAVSIPDKATVTQLRREEDDEPYQVWKIDTNSASYILKEAKESEAETYHCILSGLEENSVPALYQTISADGKTFLLMEYIDGENLRNCNRTKLTFALDSLISLQRKTWENRTLENYGYSFDKSLFKRQNRQKNLHDPLLEKAYEKFLELYRSVPRTLCHDDLLPFNIIASHDRAVLIDWEYGGILPYPTSFARLIAHTEDAENAFFYMTREDKDFATDYYYAHLLRDKDISYTDWRNTLEYFLFYEYCEWVSVGNKYGATDSEYYKKYLPLARQQARKIMGMSNE